MIYESVVKLLSDLDIFSILSISIPLDIHDLIRVVPLKYLIYFLAAINTKQVWNIGLINHDKN